MPFDVIGLAIGLLLGTPGSIPVAPDHAFHPGERAVGGWRWQAAASLDTTPGTRAALLLGRDPAAVTRCVRLNNYWCIKRGGWAGEIAADADGHVAFASAVDGAVTAALLLRRYYVDYGRRSATAIVSRWAPASCGGPVPRSARRGPPDGMARRGIGGTLRARWLAAHGRRVAGGGRLRGRASRIADPLIGATLATPTIALGLGGAPAALAASLPESLVGRPGAALPPVPACGGDAVRIAHYAAAAAAGIASSPEADLALFEADGRPTPHLARLMRNMAAVEIGPLGVGAGFVDAAVVRAAEIVAARRPAASAAPTPAVPAPGAPAAGRLDEARPPEPRP